MPARVALPHGAPAASRPAGGAGGEGRVVIDQRTAVTRRSPCGGSRRCPQRSGAVPESGRKLVCFTFHSRRGADMATQTDDTSRRSSLSTAPGPTPPASRGRSAPSRSAASAPSASPTHCADSLRTRRTWPTTCGPRPVRSCSSATPTAARSSRPPRPATTRSRHSCTSTGGCPTRARHPAAPRAVRGQPRGSAIRPMPFRGPDGSEAADLYLDLEAFHAAFAADVDRATSDVMAATQRPWNGAAFDAPSAHRRGRQGSRAGTCSAPRTSDPSGAAAVHGRARPRHHRGGAGLPRLDGVAARGRDRAHPSGRWGDGARHGLSRGR